MRYLPLLLLAACGATHGRLENIRQITTNGTHAEAYWSFDGKKIILMGVREGDKADQIYEYDLESEKLTRLSNGKGKCTCAYFLPDGRFFYSSTHHHGAEPPPPPDRSKGYRWPLYPTFDLFLNDNGEMKQLTDNFGYDAEATPSPDGKRIIFTSQREGGIGLWTMNVDGSDLKKVDHPPGYAGGAFFSWDGEWIVYRAFHPKTPEEKATWDRIREERSLVPVPMRVFVARPDGSEREQVTTGAHVDFAPSWHPDGKRIIFTSDREAKSRGQYALYVINRNGKGLRRVTTAEGFDGFPHFSPDGKRLVWISNRNAKKNPRKELDVFIADWVEK